MFNVYGRIGKTELATTTAINGIRYAFVDRNYGSFSKKYVYSKLLIPLEKIMF